VTSRFNRIMAGRSHLANAPSQSAARVPLISNADIGLAGEALAQYAKVLGDEDASSARAAELVALSAKLATAAKGKTS
jgi:hypothetical protein